MSWLLFMDESGKVMRRDVEVDKKNPRYQELIEQAGVADAGFSRPGLGQ